MTWIVTLFCFLASREAHASIYERIAGFQPHSLVTDIAALDQDQKAMEELLEQNDAESFSKARRIYVEGANSLSIAYLTLNEKLPLSIPRGVNLTGQSGNGKMVNGTLYVGAYPGDSQILFQYEVTSDADNHVACRVGGLSTSVEAIGECLQSEGTISVLGGSIPYRYDPFFDNNNGRTLQSFSLDAKRLMYDCPSCPREDFVKFRVYYGQSDYADRWVSAAFDGVKTNFVHGNADFGAINLLGRIEAIKKGVSYLGAWMYVIGLLEASVDKCVPECIDCNQEAVKLWDEAVAVYAGSLEGSDGSGHGFFTYELADKRCSDFGTCGTGGNRYTGTAFVNHEVFKLFVFGQLDVLNGLCDTAHGHKKRITSLMRVPLVQSAIKYAYIRDRQETGDKEIAEAAVSAAAILPYVYDCSQKDATMIWENMAIVRGMQSSEHVNFLQVTEAFERNYNCLDITCSDVGGLYDAQSRTYFKDASPCRGGPSRLGAGTIVIIAFAMLPAIIIITGCCIHRSRQKMVKMEPTMSSPSPEVEMQVQNQFNVHDMLEAHDTEDVDIAEKVMANPIV